MLCFVTRMDIAEQAFYFVVQTVKKTAAVIGCRS